MLLTLSELPTAHGGTVGQAHIRQRPEDFQVIEALGYGPEGEGEHAFLLIRKTNLNTQDVVRRISKLAQVRDRDIGFAGLKDRTAVTTQAFSVYLPGKDDPDWSLLQDDHLSVLEVHRHRRKIRRGSLRGNQFVLQLRDITGDRAQLQQRLEMIASAGVPNYFGEQRFGRNGNNLASAQAMLANEGKRPKRHVRSILLSAARSWIFNQVLAKRVVAGNWDQLLDGDVLLLAGSNRQFPHEAGDSEVLERMQLADIHPSGPMPGSEGHALVPQGAAKALEDQVLLEYLEWVEGLQQFRVDQDRRALRVMVEDLQWAFTADSLQLEFALHSGSYATSVLNELVDVLPGQ